MKNETIYRILSSIILIPLALFFIIKGSLVFIFFISLCFLITSYEWHMMSKKKSYNIFGFIFLIFSFYTIYKLRINSDNDYWFLLFVTIICVSTDIGGYIFGKLFKGPKLSKISPNKTQSGMIGGFVFSLISSLMFVLQYTDDIYVDKNLIENDLKFVILILLISGMSQLGDLIISYFKRSSKIKNTGNIIPGHGGLLDRIDGMIFVFPFVYLITLISIIIKL